MLSFIVASIVACLIPGPSMLLVISNTVQKGLASGLKTTLGVVTADAVLLGISLSSVGALIHTSPLLYTGMKWIGAAWIVMLGTRALMTAVEANDDLPSSTSSSYLSGVGITMVNPKVIGFYIAFFPMYLRMDQPLLPQIAVLGPLFLTIVLVVLALYAACAQAAAGVLKDRARWVQYASGISLIGCGMAAPAL